MCVIVSVNSPSSPGSQGAVQAWEGSRGEGPAGDGRCSSPGIEAGVLPLSAVLTHSVCLSGTSTSVSCKY